MENLENLLNWTKRKMFRKLKSKYIVYKFTNLQNNKIYIGITDRINERIGDHIRNSKSSNNKYKMYLHKAINKYGFNSFTFEIIEIVNSREELNIREIYWINYYNSIDSANGYNLTKGGRTNYPSEETTRKKITSSKKVKVAQYNLNGELIKSFESVKEASRQLFIADTDIHRCHKNKWSRNNFMFLKYNDIAPLNIEPYISNKGKNLLIDSFKGKNKIKCILINKKTNEVIFKADSIIELSSLSGICTSQLHRIYKNTNHTKWRIEKL